MIRKQSPKQYQSHFISPDKLILNVNKNQLKKQLLTGYNQSKQPKNTKFFIKKNPMNITECNQNIDSSNFIMNPLSYKINAKDVYMPFQASIKFPQRQKLIEQLLINNQKSYKSHKSKQANFASDVYMPLSMQRFYKLNKKQQTQIQLKIIKTFVRPQQKIPSKQSISCQTQQCLLQSTMNLLRSNKVISQVDKKNQIPILNKHKRLNYSPIKYNKQDIKQNKQSNKQDIRCHKQEYLTSKYEQKPYQPLYQNNIGNQSIHSQTQTKQILDFLTQRQQSKVLSYLQQLNKEQEQLNKKNIKQKLSQQKVIAQRKRDDIQLINYITTVKNRISPEKSPFDKTIISRKSSIKEKNQFSWFSNHGLNDLSSIKKFNHQDYQSDKLQTKLSIQLKNANLKNSNQNIQSFDKIFLKQQPIIQKPAKWNISKRQYNQQINQNKTNKNIKQDYEVTNNLLRVPNITYKIQNVPQQQYTQLEEQNDFFGNLDNSIIQKSNFSKNRNQQQIIQEDIKLNEIKQIIPHKIQDQKQQTHQEQQNINKINQQQSIQINKRQTKLIVQNKGNQIKSTLKLIQDNLVQIQQQQQKFRLKSNSRKNDKALDQELSQQNFKNINISSNSQNQLKQISSFSQTQQQIKSNQEKQHKLQQPQQQQKQSIYNTQQSIKQKQQQLTKKNQVNVQLQKELIKYQQISEYQQNIQAQQINFSQLSSQNINEFIQQQNDKQTNPRLARVQNQLEQSHNSIVYIKFNDLQDVQQSNKSELKKQNSFSLKKSLVKATSIRNNSNSKGKSNYENSARFISPLEHNKSYQINNEEWLISNHQGHNYTSANKLFNNQQKGKKLSFQQEQKNYLSIKSKQYKPDIKSKQHLIQEKSLQIQQNRSTSTTKKVKVIQIQLSSSDSENQDDQNDQQVNHKLRKPHKKLTNFSKMVITQIKQQDQFNYRTSSQQQMKRSLVTYQNQAYQNQISKDQTEVSAQKQMKKPLSQQIKPKPQKSFKYISSSEQQIQQKRNLSSVQQINQSEVSKQYDLQKIHKMLSDLSDSGDDINKNQIKIKYQDNHYISSGELKINIKDQRDSQREILQKQFYSDFTSQQEDQYHLKQDKYNQKKHKQDPTQHKQTIIYNKLINTQQNQQDIKLQRKILEDLKLDVSHLKKKISKDHHIQQKQKIPQRFANKQNKPQQKQMTSNKTLISLQLDDPFNFQFNHINEINLQDFKVTKQNDQFENKKLNNSLNNCIEFENINIKQFGNINIKYKDQQQYSFVDDDNIKPNKQSQKQKDAYKYTLSSPFFQNSQKSSSSNDSSSIAVPYKHSNNQQKRQTKQKIMQYQSKYFSSSSQAQQNIKQNTKQMLTKELSNQYKVPEKSFLMNGFSKVKDQKERNSQEVKTVRLNLISNRK